ncbi:MAG: phosphotransferase, partial [Roseiflexaceae bacterium]
GCVLRYQLLVKNSSTGQKLEQIVVGRIFKEQLACALYMRDKLVPLATLMRGRPEMAPFTAPVAMIEPLNMVVYAFPIDGELPTLIGATDQRRMTEILSEALPEVLAGQLTIQDVRMVPVNYARRYRCVMRYEIECLAPGNKLQRREVYGKVATDTQGTLIAPVIAALRERVLGNRNAYQFNIPRSLGFRPDLQLSLLEAIPGTPQINQLLKARLSGVDLSTGELTLDRALDACAQIANALHRSNIGLGRRRTLDDDLSGLRKGIREVQRVSPELGAQFQTWLERIESYAEESDALLPRFCHGDYTYAQVIFDGQQSGLVDFDTVCQAEPALDLGQFLAYLRAAAHKARKAASPGATPIGVQLGEHFLDSYIAAASEQIEDAERLRIRASVYEVVSLMRMALHSWQQLKATRLENAIAVLKEAMERLPQLDY